MPDDKRKPRVDDEEDVDDLDDILDEFSSPKDAKAKAPAAAPSPQPAPAPTSAAPASSSATASSSAPPGDDPLSADFATEFARQMESVMRELGAVEDEAPKDGAGAPKAAQTEEERQREAAFRKAWEAMLVEGMDGMGDIGEEYAGPKEKAKEKAKAKEGPKAKVDEDEFQKNIREAMERLKASDAEGRASAAAPTDDLEKMLAQLGGEGDGDGELEGILANMMGQLMSKDILYEPLKELHESFPPYLEKNAATLSAEDKKRYVSQQASIVKILAIFDEPGYKDENTEKNGQIVTLMTEMQSYGAPPAEIMGPLPPGLDLGADGMPNLPDGCVVA